MKLKKNINDSKKKNSNQKDNDQMSRKRKLKGLARNSRKKKKGEKMAFIAKLEVHFAHMPHRHFSNVIVENNV